MKHSCLLAILNLLLFSSRAEAHASEQGFVLLLPTDLYTGAGVVAVALTAVALIVVRPGGVNLLFRPLTIPRIKVGVAKLAVSCASFLLVLALIYAGLSGPRDPLANPLPLMVWTVVWIALVSVQGVLGNIWGWVSPFYGPLQVLNTRLVMRYPSHLGHWPALLGFFAFSYVLLADPAPSDPYRLARLVGAWLFFNFGFCLVFGPRWLVRGEPITVMMRLYGRVAIWRCRHIGVAGWRITKTSAGLLPAALAVILLGTGSFDGLNETFWWLGILGINPFEYPGRSALIWETTAGLIGANIGLLIVFTAALWVGHRIAGAATSTKAAFCGLAPTLLPIALGYHVAHYLPSIMVDGQYAMVALSDPFLNGSDLLGLGQFYVTTGFFNTQDSVRVIYLTQAGAVVIGHVIAVLTAHAVALRLYQTHKAAVLSQIPLACFMIAYTWFGLWLLASPRF